MYWAQVINRVLLQGLFTLVLSTGPCGHFLGWQNHHTHQNDCGEKGQVKASKTVHLHSVAKKVNFYKLHFGRNGDISATSKDSKNV